MAGKTKTTTVDQDATNEIYKVAQEEKNIEIAELKETQSRLAEAHEMIGRIQGVGMLTKMATVSTLVWLKDVKDSKLYRDLPNIGTWEDFCNYLKKDRRTVDEDLQNLNAFGEDFLATVASLRVGYRDLRKLRQLSHDGAITIDAEAVQINGERIPLDPDHKEDLQAAIEQIIEEQSRVKEEFTAQKKAHDRVQEDTRKSMIRLEKELGKFTAAAEGKGLTPDEDAFLKQVEITRMTFFGYMDRVNPETALKQYETVTPRMQAALISLHYYFRQLVLASYDQAIEAHGNPVMNPEILEDYERWQAAFDAKG